MLKLEAKYKISVLPVPDQYTVYLKTKYSPIAIAKRNDATNKWTQRNIARQLKCNKIVIAKS